MAASSTHDDEGIVAINVTPLVDITLVLLIVFMVAASFIVQETIEVDLPRAAAPEQAVQRFVSVLIDEEAHIYFDGSLVDETALKAQITGALAKDPETRAIVTADQRLDYGRVMHLIDLVKGQGVERFALNIQRPEGARAGVRLP